MEEYDLTQAQLAEIVGKSRSGVANTLRILNLDERVLNLAKEVPYYKYWMKHNLLLAKFFMGQMSKRVVFLFSNI